ncbi:MAG: Maf family protein [Bacillota bacterium]|nr:Maf family protein [Bacillota bacterium]
MRIILASASPRRRELLEKIGLKFDIIPADIEETTDFTEPDRVVCDLCLKKAMYISQRYKNDIIISADTIVYFGGACLGKPESEEQAALMLRSLSGKTHKVYTGVTVLKGDIKDTRYEVTKVRFRDMSDSEISSYIRTGEPMDKAGSYGIQGFGMLFIEGIEGDYQNVMGLPVKTLYDMLKKVGVFLI